MRRTAAFKKGGADPEEKLDFRGAVEITPHLESAWNRGLQALRAEDKPHIVAEDTRRLKGSVDVDSALAQVEPNANRWDFAIAYDHSDRTEEVIYWTELHTASDGEVSVVIAKTRWLLAWLATGGSNLDPFEREIVWVASGATTFTRTSPQQRRMAQEGLRYVGSHLRIRNQRG